MIGDKKRAVLTNLASMQKEFKDGECYLVSADSIKTINYLRNEFAITGVRKLGEIDIPLVYNENGYFEEQLTGKNLKVSLPISSDGNNFESVMIFKDKILSCDSKIEIENYVSGISDGLYLSSDKMVKVPRETAVLNFMKSVRNNDEAELIIGDILLSSYRSRKLLEKIREAKQDAIKEFETVRENANNNYEVKKDETFFAPTQVEKDIFANHNNAQEEELAPLEQEHHIDFTDIQKPVFEHPNINYYLSYRDEKNTLKNRFIRNFKAFKSTIKQTIMRPVKLNRKINSAKHVGKKKTYSLKYSHNAPKHAAKHF